MPRRLSQPSSSSGPKPPFQGPLCYLGNLGGHLYSGRPRWDQIPWGNPEMDGAKEPAQLQPHEHPWAPSPKHHGGSCSTSWWASVPHDSTCTSLKCHELTRVSLYPWKKLLTNQFNGAERRINEFSTYKMKTTKTYYLVDFWRQEFTELSLCYTSLHWFPQISKPGD